MSILSTSDKQHVGNRNKKEQSNVTLTWNGEVKNRVLVMHRVLRITEWLPTARCRHS